MIKRTIKYRKELKNNFSDIIGYQHYLDHLLPMILKRGAFPKRKQQNK